ncbi:MAG: secondary thiamine-phosphate synthase enzyme YjbQ, partial [Actinomycetota bacterium]
MRTIELELDTTGRELVDLTDDVRDFCRAAGDGLLNVFVPHATAGLAILELG